ncbi:iron-siderophore ABC transporter substrate-binding protein [Nocardiopsis sp. HNM0947]|uniref:Iron-siderophore ABC transporter substrate-binding protein n=1 Tax=Nocardiopsis coralli TaxID=2772213 RepID=A0ABR9P103_9ACTN|nr:iron-siderophore ABC transporter substrate-binding protein [Nocardiopsis coralli]MBE2997534.1 iron-siderophore ABC transporter substrate-binding protein [Nocardiopsis coralli]
MNPGPLPRVGVLGAAAASLLLVTSCAGQDPDPGSADGEGTRTVETVHGDVEVPENPTDVVALGWSDAEAALALGVEPLGVADWLEYGGNGVGPWVDDLVEGEPVQLGTMEPNVEATANLEPDVILDTRSDLSQERYDMLAPVAPVVGPPPGVEITYGTTWQQQTRQVATALNEEERGEEVVTELEDRFAELREEHPEFADHTIAVGAYNYDGGFGAYVPGDSRTDLLTDLGFEYDSDLADMADGAFYTDLASEDVEALDADLTVVFPLEAGAAGELESDPVLQGLESAQDDRLIVLDDQDLIDAFSSGSAPGVHAALDGIVPLLTEALEQ